MKQILNRLINHESISSEEAKEVLVNISKGVYNQSQIASFLTVYMMRNITLEELKGFRDALLELCIPIDLKEFTYGFLYTSGLIKKAADIESFYLDKTKWIAELEMKETPDPSLTQRRVYTSGCGRGVMYTSINEIAYRRPLEHTISISSDQILSIATWLQRCSELYRETRAVHTAALSINGETPLFFFDDIGRHNAVDKVIGKGLIDNVDFSQVILISSGRASSEILHKARTAQIAINISRGAPTHQTVLRAREMGITVIGFAKSNNFTIYAHEKRVKF